MRMPGIVTRGALESALVWLIMCMHGSSQGLSLIWLRHAHAYVPRRRAYGERAHGLVERHALEVAALTWNVAEARPEAGAALHRWVTDLSRDAALTVLSLQACCAYTSNACA